LKTISEGSSLLERLTIAEGGLEDGPEDDEEDDEEDDIFLVLDLI